MTQRQLAAGFLRSRKRREERHKRIVAKMARWREAKARKRQALIDAGLLEREPKMQRAFRFEFAIKNKDTGETHWHDLVSVRHATKALGLILKFC